MTEKAATVRVQKDPPAPNGLLVVGVDTGYGNTKVYTMRSGT